jgi:ABC-2 type transport system permease protein
VTDTAPAGGDDARILDRGYRPYDGPRSGAPGAVRSVAWQGMRAVLGLGRPARSKMLPLLAIAFAYLPAVAFVGVAAILPVDLVQEGLVADYAGYYFFITAAIALFCALVAPEVLVGDRRTGMLALYLSTPLTRSTYVLAKSLAVAATLGLVTIGPPLLLLVAYTFEGIGPAGPGDWVVLFVRILAAGAAVTAVYAAVSLAAASLTDRRAFASVGIILLILVSATLAGVLVEDGGMSQNLYALDLLVVPFELVQRIYGQPGEVPEMATSTVVAGVAAWTLAGAAVVAARYRTLVVDR